MNSMGLPNFLASLAPGAPVPLRAWIGVPSNEPKRMPKDPLDARNCRYDCTTAEYTKLKSTGELGQPSRSPTGRLKGSEYPSLVRIS